MLLPIQTRLTIVLSVFAVLWSLPLQAAERVTLRGGAQFDCLRREAEGDKVRLYLLPTSAKAAEEDSNYVQIPADSVLSVESIPDPPPPPDAKPAVASSERALTPAEMREMLSRAGSQHNIDADLLASVVKAESNGNVHAVSRAGAQGLMQLMPATATTLGVHDSFAPDQNIVGGTAYLDQLLKRYKDNVALALAAYNAGPLAVDRYHGVPPYRETRAYVARVIREFNRRKLAASATPATASAAH